MTNDIEMTDLSKRKQKNKRNKPNNDITSSRYKGNTKRSCTDVCFLLFFILFLSCWGFMIFFFSKRIDFEQTLYPSNTFGEICGRGKQSGKPYLAYFNIFKCASSPEISIVEGCSTPQVCVEECPGKTFSINKFDKPSVRKLQAQLAICLPGVTPTADNILQLAEDGKCARYYFNSDSIGGRCFPSVVKMFGKNSIFDEITKDAMLFGNNSNITPENLIKSNQVLSTLMGTLNIVLKAVKDIIKTWRWILIGLVEVLIITILWIYLLQYTAYLITWITIITVLILNVVGLHYSFEHYKSFDVQPSSTVESLIQTRENIAASNPKLQFRSMDMTSFEDFPILESRAVKYVNVAEDENLNLELNLMGMLKDNLNDFLNQQSTWKWISIILAASLVILLLTVFCLCTRIRLACAVIQESGKAVMDMKSTLIFPIVPFILYLVCLVGAFTALVIVSAGTHKNYRFPNGTLCTPENLEDSHYQDIGVRNNNRTHVTHSTNSLTTFTSFTNLFNFSTLSNPQPDGECKFDKLPFERRTIYLAHGLNLFAIIWIMFFLGDLCFATLSGSFSMWYWTYHKSDVPFFTLLSSFRTILFYHLGSLAFGSFFLTIVRFIRIVIEFFDKYCQKYGQFKIVQWIKVCLSCCFWCLESFIRFLNRNAYIYMAMYGTSFLTSARKAFEIITKNVVRAFVLNSLTSLLLFLSKIFVTLIVGVSGYFLLTNQFPSIATFDLQYYWAPLGSFLFLSYILSGALFGVYEVAIDTIFFCYLKDSEDNDGSPEKPYFMSKSLAKVFGKKNSPNNL